jgi:hypothetical protein
MMSIKSTLLAAATMLAMAPLSTHAHIILKHPVPYGVQTKDPLAPDGSNYPTKGIALTVNTINQWAVGSKQELVFTGTAVHGGGSCQVSVTKDKVPTKDSKFKVIHSFEGGCPASIEGNYPDTGGDPAPHFPFEVPSELPNGEYTGAWSWSNKIGQREFYMALFPVTISGGSDDTAAFDTLPDMAVANIKDVGGTCVTMEGSDYKYPNPGKYVTSGGTGSLEDLCSGGGALAEGGSGGGSGGDAGSSATQVSSQAPATPSSAAIVPSTLRTIKTATAPMTPLLATSTAEGVFAPSASGTPAPQITGQPSAAPIAPQPSAAPAPAPNTPNSTSCSPDGAIVCSEDGTQFGICNFGKAIMGLVASGTKCTNGAIVKRGDYSHRNQRTVV